MILHTKSPGSPKSFHEAPRKLQKKTQDRNPEIISLVFCPNDETKRTFWNELTFSMPLSLLETAISKAVGHTAHVQLREQVRVKSLEIEWPLTSDTLLFISLARFVFHVYSIHLKRDAQCACCTQLGQLSKTRQKLDWRNSSNWRIIVVTATIWQILDMQSMQWPETEIMWICRNFLVKTREITYFQRIVAFLESLCCSLLPVRSNSFWHCGDTPSKKDTLI